MLPDDSSYGVPPDAETPASNARDPVAGTAFDEERAERSEAETSRPAATLRCPVCRARQPLQPTCRRCKADLGLLVAALREIGRLRSRHAQAVADGDEETASRIADQLRQLQGEVKGEG